MAKVNVDSVISQLGISKSYLYKIIRQENILIEKSKTGRYFWNEKAVNTIKEHLYKDSFLHVDKTKELI